MRFFFTCLCFLKYTYCQLTGREGIKIAPSKKFQESCRYIGVRTKYNVRMQSLHMQESDQADSSINDTFQNNRNAARTRRQRGYQWEETLVKRFNGQSGWTAFRLGSPSHGLPDILAVHTKTKHLVVIEAKSGSGTTLLVPPEQIERCQVWLRTFSAYAKRHLVLAYKFHSKKRIGLAQYRPREIREFYKVWHPRTKAVECICTYDGDLFTKSNDARKKIRRAECVMPFKTRQPFDSLADARIIF